MSSITPNTSKVPGWSAVLRWLVEPSVSLPAIQRQQARLLMSFQLVLIATGTLYQIIFSLIKPGSGGEKVTVFFIAALIFVYVLSHRGYLRISAALIVFLPYLGVLLLFINNTAPKENVHFLVYTIIPLLASSIFFSRKGVGLTTILFIIGIISLTFIYPSITLDKLFTGPIAFLLISTSIIQVSTLHRDNIENEHQKELINSESRFRMMFENHQVSMLLIEPDSGAIMDANTAAQKFYGYSTETLKQMLIQEINILPPEEVAGHLNDVLNGHRNFLVFPHLLASGDVRTVEVYSTPIIINGKPILSSIIHDVTEQKQAEDDLSRLNRQLELILNTAGEGIYGTDLEGKVIFVNPAMAQMIGWDASDLVGRPIHETCHHSRPDDKPYPIGECPFYNSIREGFPQQAQFDYFWHKDGRGFPIEYTSAPIIDADKLIGSVVVVKDITERKQTEEIAHQQSEQIRFLYEASQQLNRTLDLKEIYQTICDFVAIIAPSDTLFISAYDTQTQSITCSAYWMRGVWLDVSPFPPIPLEEEGKGTQSRVIRSGQSMLINDYEAFLKTAQNVYYVNDETNEINSDDPPEEEVTRSALIVPLKSGGIVRGVFQVASYRQNAYTETQLKLLEAMALHITSAEQNAQLYSQLLNELNERKLAENAMRESNETAQAILNAATESVFLMDISGKVIAANETTADRLGKPVTDIVGASIYDFVPTDVAETRKERLNNVVRERKPVIFEDERFGIWMENSIYPIFDNDGEIRRVAIYGRDITERKNLENAILRSEAMLTEAQRIGSIGHLEWSRPDTELVCSDEVYRILDLPRSTVITKNAIAGMMDAEDSKRLNEMDRAAIAQGGDTNYEYHIQRKDGKTRWIHQRSKFTYDSTNTPVRMIATIQDITERKQTEIALHESESRAQAMLQAIPDLLFRMDGKGTYLDYKAGIHQLYYQSGQIIGKRTRDTLPPEISSLIEEKIEATLRTSLLQTFEYQLDVPGSGVRDFEARMVPSGMDEVLSLVHDITEKKKAEAALRASEEKYRGLMESLDSVIATVDYDGKFLYLNDVAAGQLGSNAEDLIGKTMHDLFPDTIASRQMENIQKAMNEDCSEVYEDITLVQGKPRWYRTFIQPIHDEAGQAAYVLINSNDIHDLKTVQQELEELNRTLEERVQQRTAEVQDLYENAPAGYHSIDTNGDVILINQTELNWLGYTREEVLGRHISNFQTPESFAEFKRNFPIFKKHGQLQDLELEFVRKDGSTIPVLINAIAVYDEYGNYLMSRSTVLDNTNQKAAEEALQTANFELARAMRMKDEFLASMSHELRTPLTGILGLSEALQLKIYGELNTKQEKTLKTIEDSGHHLLELINDILDLSKIEAGKLELQPGSCSLADICMASLQLTKGMAGQKQQHVQYSLPGEPIIILADARRLKQVLVNLLGNAIKFTPESGELGLEVKVSASENKVHLIVWDKGIGIKPEDMPKLFKPFTQIDSSLAREYSGTGLGLSLVQRLVELHNGSVKVESVFGEGSRFIITLPWQPQNATNVSTDPKPAASIEMDLERSNLPLIMIADDNETVLEILGDFLEVRQYRVVKFRSGKELLERAAEYLPDLMLVDIQMPGMDGLEAIRRIRSHSNPTVAATPVIAVTALAMSGDRERCLEAGANDYMSKPVKLLELVEVIKKQIKENNR